MRKYYYVIEQDDLWYIRVRGKIYGGYLMKEQALRHAISSAKHSIAEAYVVVLQPSGEYKVEWSNRTTGRGHPVGSTLMLQPPWRRIANAAKFPQSQLIVRPPKPAEPDPSPAPIALPQSGNLGGNLGSDRCSDLTRPLPDA